MHKKASCSSRKGTFSSHLSLLGCLCTVICSRTAGGGRSAPRTNEIQPEHKLIAPQCSIYSHCGKEQGQEQAIKFLCQGQQVVEKPHIPLRYYLILHNTCPKYLNIKRGGERGEKVSRPPHPACHKPSGCETHQRSGAQILTSWNADSTASHMNYRTQQRAACCLVKSLQCSAAVLCYRRHRNRWSLRKEAHP